jgi:hypothetical protein
MSRKASKASARDRSPLALRVMIFTSVLGPWRWLLMVYAFDESEDRVVVVAIEDGRSSTAATTPR